MEKPADPATTDPIRLVKEREIESDTPEPSPRAERNTSTPLIHVDAPAKKEAKLSAGGVRFGKVEIVPPLQPALAPMKDIECDECDSTDEDFEVEVFDTDPAGEENDAELKGVQIPGNIPELPKGLLSQLLANGSLGDKVLHKAAAEGDVEELRRLLAPDGEMNGLIDDRDIFAYTPLHIAAENGKLEVCEALIGLKADVNACTKLYSSTALHYAVFEGHDKVAKLLLDSGAEVNALTDDKRTPIFQAAFKGQLACVELLLKYGADPKLCNEESKAPADVAATDVIKEVLADLPAVKKCKSDTGESTAK